jgi:hypothetical protein
MKPSKLLINSVKNAPVVIAVMILAVGFGVWRKEIVTNKKAGK